MPRKKSTPKKKPIPKGISAKTKKNLQSDVFNRESQILQDIGTAAARKAMAAYMKKKGWK